MCVVLEGILDEADLLPTTWMEEGGRVRYGHLIYLMEFIKQDEMWRVERETGGGKAWGTVVHRLLETMVKHRQDINREAVSSLPLAQWLEEEALPKESVSELVQVANSMMGSAHGGPAYWVSFQAPRCPGRRPGCGRSVVKFAS